MSTRIWFAEPTVENTSHFDHTLVAHLGIEMLEIGDDYLVARMPVDHRTHQPQGLLHGGASVALAETMGSIGAFLTVDPARFAVVGLEINANHIRGVRSGWVIGRATPLHRGRTTQVWEIRIADEAGKLVCVSRITMAILEKTPSA
jgi:1,4-dihydroxy-2-naphthoyl-CoA hydrolase